MKNRIITYIQLWISRCYSSGIPDVVPPRITQLNKAPSYKAIVSAILKNDVQLKTLGMSPKKTIIYSEFKRIEIENRKGLKQGNLFFNRHIN